MPETPKTDNIVRELSVDVRAALRAFRDEELRNSGIFKDQAIKLGFGYLETRTERITKAVVTSAVSRYGHLTVAELVDLLNGLLAEQEGA